MAFAFGPKMGRFFEFSTDKLQLPTKLLGFAGRELQKQLAVKDSLACGKLLTLRHFCTRLST